MTKTEFINHLSSKGFDKEVELLNKRMKKETGQLFISDTDDEAYNTELANFLQNSPVTWFNNINKNGFTAIFK